jgi:hypothetical protein
MWAKNEQYKDELKWAKKATIYGGDAFGGPDVLPEGFIKQPKFDSMVAATADQGDSVAFNLATNKGPKAGRSDQSTAAKLANAGGQQGPLLGSVKGGYTSPSDKRRGGLLAGAA